MPERRGAGAFGQRPMQFFMRSVSAFWNDGDDLALLLVRGAPIDESRSSFCRAWKFQLLPSLVAIVSSFTAVHIVYTKRFESASLASLSR